MIPNAAVLHRGKHFDLLLARELAFIKREHEQNLITHKNLEKSIRRDTNQIKKIHRKKISIAPIDEIYNRHNENFRLSIASNNNDNNDDDSQKPIDETPPQIFPRYHRNCFKGQRLPPIFKLNRPKRTNNDLHWIASVQSTNTQKQNIKQALTILNEELRQGDLPKLTPTEKQIHSFIETLPINKGVQRGFDNFAPASLYSTRAPVALI